MSSSARANKKGKAKGTAMARSKVSRKHRVVPQPDARTPSLIKRFWRRCQGRVLVLWRRLLVLLPYGRRQRAASLDKAAATASRQGVNVRRQLLPDRTRKRTLAEWKDLRRRTTAEVKLHLAEDQPIPAIKKLTRALLEDPQHPAYHQLLKRAVEQRRRRRVKAGRKDPWVDLPRGLRQDALQLEALTVFVDELEHLFDKAGIPPLSAPPPPGLRPAGTSSQSAPQQQPS